MSHSYKQVSKYVDRRNYKQLLKRYWNKKVRHSFVANGNYYKKLCNDRDFEDDMSWYSNKRKQREDERNKRYYNSWCK